MKFLSAGASTNNVENFNTSVENGDTVFVIFHSPDCGHCVTTLPVWKKMYTELKDRFKDNNKVMVADISADVMMQTPYGEKIEGFPTMWCITKKGAKIDPIENAKLMNTPRTIDAFIEWVELKTPSIYSSSSNHVGDIKIHKNKKYRVTPYPHSSKKKRNRSSFTRKYSRKSSRNRHSRKH